MQQNNAVSFERVLVWALRIGVGLILLTPLVVSKSLFFPFVTGKNFYFRIIVELMAGAWIALGIINKKYWPRNSAVLWAFISFIGVLTLATILGVSPYHSFWSNFERMEGLITYLHLGLLFLIVASVLKTKKEWFVFLLVALGVSALVSIFASCEHFFYAAGSSGPQTQIQALCTTGSGGERPYATFGNAIYLAVYEMFSLFFIAMLAYHFKDRAVRALLGVFFLFELYIFFLAESRGAFLGLSAGVALIALLAIFSGTHKTYKYAAGALLFGIVLLGAVIIVFPQSSFVKQNPIFSRFSLIAVGNLSREPRVLIWGIGIDAFKERPILGWGPENFIIPYAKYYKANLFGNEPWFDRAHNMIIEWLVAAGLLGLFAYAGIFATSIRALWRAQKKNDIDPLFAFGGIGLALAYIVQDIFVFDVISTYLFFVFGVAFTHFLSVEHEGEPLPIPNSAPLRLASAFCALVIAFVVAYSLNAKPIFAARQIIVALQSAPEQTTSADFINLFDRVIAYDTFGVTETRERLADIVIQAGAQLKSLSPEYLEILGYAAKGLEIERERFPLVIRYPVFLGKLYAVRTVATGQGGEEAESAYMRALSFAPEYIPARLGLAEYYLLSKQYDKAREQGKIAFNQISDPVIISRILNPLLSIDLLAGAPQDAHTLLTEYIEKYEQENIYVTQVFGISEVRLLVSRALSRPENLQDRKKFFELLEQKFIESKTQVNPQILPVILVGIAQTEAELGDFVTARQTALRAVELDPSFKDQVDQFLQSLEAIRK